MNWEYSQTTKIVFGNGVIKNISDVIQEGECLLITSASFLAMRMDLKINQLLNGRISVVYGNVSPNPDIEQCLHCLNMIKNKKISYIIALGGGSVMDLAKVISVAAVSDCSLSEWFNHIPISSKKPIDLIAIPTTAGTGSEVTCVSVITDYDRKLKQPLMSEMFYPKVAFIDPELTYSTPAYITACTGFDVICHAIEAYWSKNHQPICDALAIHAIKLVLNYLEIAYQSPFDVMAREKMAEASVIAGLSFRLPKTTAVHACSYPLTNLLKIPHGEACALTLCKFIEFTYNNGCDRVLSLAKQIGFTSVQELLVELSVLREKVGLLSDLKGFEISKELENQIIMDCQNETLKNHPIEVSEKDLKKLFLSLR